MKHTTLYIGLNKSVQISALQLSQVFVSDPDSYPILFLVLCRLDAAKPAIDT